MSVEISGVSCRNCGGTLPSARPGRFAHGRQPCPACGPGNRFVKVVIEFHSDLTLKKKMTRGFRSGGGRSRAAQEHWTGYVLGADGTRRDRQRVVDREHNHYIERVTDEDGTVIRDVDEPLDDHQGQRSAKSSPDLSQGLRLCSGDPPKRR